jgi:hypothetical protein
MVVSCESWLLEEFWEEDWFEYFFNPSMQVFPEVDRGKGLPKYGRGQLSIVISRQYYYYLL